ncbi:MAG: hypothetical protein CM1200mP14_15500 [Gammaproteobacteria bacterium]|nr:MAG: hypothetical protein CM1200mP14_15500 [Gammaproteobacteria bacterium]
MLQALACLRAIEGLRAGSQSVLTELVNGNINQISAALVYEALQLGSVAHEIILEPAKFLGIGIANLINTLNPDVVVVVGGVVGAGDYLSGPFVKKQAAFIQVAFEGCKIFRQLPETAGLLGPRESSYQKCPTIVSEQRTLGVIGALVWDRFLRTGPVVIRRRMGWH